MISVKEIGRGFFTLWTAIIVLLGGIALGLGVRGAASAQGGMGGSEIGGAPFLLAVSLLALLLFWVLLRAGAPRAATIVLLLSAISGALVLRSMAVGIASSPAGVALRVTTLLLSALAVGAVTVAMVLGHWYLVQPKLALAPLRRLCDVLLGILVVRLAVSGWGVASGLREGPLLSSLEPIPWEAIILCQRLLFGFVGALVLAVLIRKTVALRSTMSATGLLYIAILFVWVGEFLSLYLWSSTGGRLVV